MSHGLYPTRRVMWMPLELAWKEPSASMKMCCQDMSKALAFSCEQHDSPFDCPDGLVVYHEIFDEYGLPVRDGGMSYVLLSHCPWCGARLPDSQRDRWFDLMEERDIDTSDISKVPEEYLSAAWRTGSSGRAEKK